MATVGEIRAFKQKRQKSRKGDTEKGKQNKTKQIFTAQVEEDEEEKLAG